MTKLIDIAEAVKTEMNGHTFSQAFTAQRAYVPVYDLTDMKALHVTVVPRAVDEQAAGRGATQRDCAIDIGVQKKLSFVTPQEIDPLMALVEEIAGFFRLRRLTACAGAIWQKTEYRTVYAPDHMEQLRQFTSVLALTFRVVE